jgi:hypothetical protein
LCAFCVFFGLIFEVFRGQEGCFLEAYMSRDVII